MAAQIQASPGRPVDHSMADEWAADWMAEISASRYRRARIRTERRFPSPWAEQLQKERDYDDETEHLRRFIQQHPIAIGATA